MLRPPSDDANVPVDAESIAIHVLVDDAPASESDDDSGVFAFAPPDRALDDASYAHARAEPAARHGPPPSAPLFAPAHEPETLDIPQEELDAWDDDVKDGPFPYPTSRRASRLTLDTGKDDACEHPMTTDALDPLQSDWPASRDSDDLYAYGRTVPLHLPSRGYGLHHRKSIGGHSDVPSTVHSIDMDSLSGSSLRRLSGGPLRRTMSQEYAMCADLGGTADMGLSALEMLPLHAVDKNGGATETDGYELGEDPADDSPYPEVRASVSNIDDPSMPVMTIRMWVMAILLSVLAGSANMFFSFRYPSPSISPIIVLLAAYPLGKLLARTLPIGIYLLPWWLGGAQFTLNPGPFNIKEHTLITVMVNITIFQAYAINLIVVHELPRFYGRPLMFSFQYVFTIASQVIGIGFSGLLQQFLVRPASAIWPQVLVLTTILNTLHAEEDMFDNTISRFRWLSYVGIGGFFYNFIPNFLFNALSQFCWGCWISPDNATVNVVFGTLNGMGLSLVSFDWSQISYISSPLVTPWWAELNLITGFVVFTWLIAPIIYFTNAWETAFFPFSSPMSFDRFSEPYDVERVVSKNSYTIDEAAYQAYSPVLISAVFILSYFAGFASITAVLFDTLMNHFQPLYRVMNRRAAEPDDVHAKLMRPYPSVVTWWYYATVLICFFAIVAIVEYSDVNVKATEIVLALCLPALYSLPSGYVFAATGQMIGTNIVSDVVGAYLLPNNPIGFLLFKTLAVQPLIGCLSSVSDMKLGHYMKVPPRNIYMVQIVGTVVVACVQVGIKSLMYRTTVDLCEPSQESKMTCPGINVFYTASQIWGVIGPDRLFRGSAYKFMLAGLCFGAALPVMIGILYRRFRLPFLRYTSVPVMLYGVTLMPTAATINITSWFIVAFIFQYVIRRYHFHWWSKYNFVTSSAMDTGTIVSELVIFFVLQLPSNGTWQLSWWGNDVVSNTADAMGKPLREAPPGGIPYR
ncbi:hypothetical protein MSPP1_000155 [Malassezia sp. CBS 17886]|nr:hypothetical protein MSPP1_000155 [Malassezia sp. CBS 17886]